MRPKSTTKNVVVSTCHYGCMVVVIVLTFFTLPLHSDQYRILLVLAHSCIHTNTHKKIWICIDILSQLPMKIWVFSCKESPNWLFHSQYKIEVRKVSIVGKHLWKYMFFTFTLSARKEAKIVHPLMSWKHCLVKMQLGHVVCLIWLFFVIALLWVPRICFYKSL